MSSSHSTNSHSTNSRSTETMASSTETPLLFRQGRGGRDGSEWSAKSGRKSVEILGD